MWGWILAYLNVLNLVLWVWLGWKLWTNKDEAVEPLRQVSAAA